MDINRARMSVRKLAMQEGKTETKIVEDIEKAISEAMKNAEKDPKVKRLWEQIPCEGNIPNAYELIVYVGEEIERKTLS